MPIKNIYLTIDDSPSKHMKKKTDFLATHEIPAVFFCRGEFIALSQDYVVDAIQKGFLIGNHSYTHPYFSQISLEKCFDEISKTEELIEECYQKAKIQRPFKVIRLPFGDRGTDVCIKTSSLDARKDKGRKIQAFIKDLGFVPLDFHYKTLDNCIDAYWSWDTQDYKTKLIENPKEYRNKLEEFWNCSQEETQVLLLHDFAHSHHLFEATMEFLLSKKLNFLSFKAGKI